MEKGFLSQDLEKEYLTKEQLIGFENYKYSCKDTSPFSTHVMHPFWNRVVEYCPKWVAPNLLTFAGFIFTLITVFMYTILDYSFQSSNPDSDATRLPKWTFTLSAINLFVAYTLDGIDGKQARRTGSSGPLGELFDHGLDSYTAGLIPIVMYSIFGRGSKYSIEPLRMYFIIWSVLVNFHLSHWEKYNTGVLFLPWGYDITMWITSLCFLVAGIWGHEIWQIMLPGGINTGILFETAIYGSSLFSNLPVILWNIYVSYRDRTGYMRSLSEALRPFVPLVILFILCFTWVFKSPSNILDIEPRIIFFLTGTIFSNICCRLIVAQMSSSRCELFNFLLIPTAFVVFTSLIIKSVRLEIFLTYALCLVVTIAHIHYATCVVRQMCKHFRINCFTLRKHSD